MKKQIWKLIINKNNLSEYNKIFLNDEQIKNCKSACIKVDTNKTIIRLDLILNNNLIVEMDETDMFDKPTEQLKKEKERKRNEPNR